MRALTFEQLQNLGLEDVSGRPDLCRIRMASQAEIDALAGPAGDGIDRGVVTDWRFIALETKTPLVVVVLIGNRGRENYGTSPVVVIDQPGAKVRTRSGSIYNLALPGEGEPPLEHVLHVCSLLNKWGLGAVLDLPEVY